MPIEEPIMAVDRHQYKVLGILAEGTNLGNTWPHQRTYHNPEARAVPAAEAELNKKASPAEARVASGSAVLVCR